ncbi:MAG: hypothetical protein SGI92_23310, partial [Bryobacteraceae bacterium]|nr:hypothetical protein [Bryobacteraceae bacterium]
MLCFSVAWLRPSGPVVLVRDEGDAAQISPTQWEGTTGHRYVYPMSVVPGGVYSAAEVERARRIDPVVAIHYAGLNVVQLRRELLEEPVLRYVSFRRGNQVYWTRRPMRIPAGEAVLADGDRMVRARCGNRLSESPEEPVLPVTEKEPTVVDLEIPMPPESAPLPLVARLWPGDAGVGGVSPGTAVELVSGDGVSAVGTSGNSAARSDATVAGFRGFNALAGGMGSGMPPPSQNPAVSGPQGVGVLEPGRFLPLPDQLRPELPLVQPVGGSSFESQ